LAGAFFGAAFLAGAFLTGALLCAGFLAAFADGALVAAGLDLADVFVRAAGFGLAVRLAVALFALAVALPLGDLLPDVFDADALELAVFLAAVFLVLVVTVALRVAAAAVVLRARLIGASASSRE
jgi:hypothetical protein